VRAVLTALGVWSLAATCATAPPAKGVPAVITNPTLESRIELVRVVTEALHGGPVSVAEDALVHDSTLILERGKARGPDGTPLQGRDPGRPERFLLVRTGAGCALVHEGSGRSFPLGSAVTCAPK
jgi:hypothetical protein